jgi:hypothetical protein
VSAHSEIEAHLGRKGVTFSGATAGITTVTAGNNTLDSKNFAELERIAQVYGHEVVFTAGALKIRPANSNL